MPRPVPALALASLALLPLAFAGCQSTVQAPTARTAPPVRAAEREFAQAPRHFLSQSPEGRREARQAAERAAALDPGWVAPQRLIDDLMREDLLGLDALRLRREEAAEALARLKADSSTDTRSRASGALYLAGRLEGREGAWRFVRSIALDPGSAWGYHGLAWDAEANGDLARALKYRAQAFARARGAWEHCFFGAAQAQLLAMIGRGDEAALLLSRLLQGELARADRLTLSVQLAGALMQPGGNRSAFIRGYELGLDLLYDEDLAELELLELVDRMTFPSLGRSSDEAFGELLLALGSREGAERARIAAELRLMQGPSALSLALLENGSGGARGIEAAARGIGSPVSRRHVRFALGDYGHAVQEWLESLPRFLLDGEGLPRDARLAELVRSSRGLTRATASPEELERLARELVAVGWFAEARLAADALASAAPGAPEAALELERQAVAGAVLVRGLSRLARAADRTDAILRGTEPVTSLDDYLNRVDPLWRRYGSPLGVPDLGPPLADSPRETFGPFGSLVNPGPRYTVQDEARGRGVAGQPVPGLAHVLDSLGRFGTFGEVMGVQGPDATLLPRVVVEQGAGEHLGVAWQGTVVWCEGAELPTRAGRLGAAISAAAVHEGYWVDLEGPRLELVAWHELERRFFGEDSTPGRVERALATVGLPLADVNESVRRPERVRLLAALGEASRVRLTILSERRAAGRPGPDLDELARVTAVHEEGHLCDRTRFLPLTKRPFQLFGLLLRSGFSANAVQGRLEYRAQLVALVDSPEPRIALAEVLDSARGGVEFTPHGSAYRDLLHDLLRALDRELVSNATDWPAIDADRYLVHQMHLLGPEEVRRLSWILARREGLVENGAELHARRVSPDEPPQPVGLPPLTALAR